ncbi:sensor histidine kinase, partial [Calditrichota bacterium]
NLIINADKEAVSEAIINLLDNAIKYSNNDKKIFVSTGEENETVYVKIEDQGIGIKPENQKYIFDKFYRVSDGSTFSTKGSGLGLSLVQHIMDSHDGSVVVDSTPGKGSMFKLVFKKEKE